MMKFRIPSMILTVLPWAWAVGQSGVPSTSAPSEALPDSFATLPSPAVSSTMDPVAPIAREFSPEAISPVAQPFAVEPIQAFAVDPVDPEAAPADRSLRVLQYAYDNAALLPDVTSGGDAFYNVPGSAVGGSDQGLSTYLQLGVVYDDNIYLDEASKESDVIFSGTVGAMWRRSTGQSSVAVGGSVTGFVFADNSDNNGVNADIWASAARTFGRLSVDGKVRYAHMSGSDRDVGDFAERDLAAAQFNAAYELGGKTRLTGGIDYETSAYDAYNDTTRVAGRFGVDYAFSPKLRLGVQGVGGYETPQGGADQTFEQANLTASYRATHKLSFDASAGWEWRQSDGADYGDTDSFVYSLAGHWAPRESTLVTLRGQRQTYASSIYNNTNRESTNVELSVNQRLWQRFQLGVAAGYEFSDYTGQGGTGGDGREDDYFYVRSSVAFSITHRLSTSVFYDYRNNDSDTELNSYESNRFGASLTYSF